MTPPHRSSTFVAAGLASAVLALALVAVGGVPWRWGVPVWLALWGFFVWIEHPPRRPH